MKTKRNFKDSVFSTLFNNPELLRELYCAIEGVSLPSNIPVSINTLKNVLVMDLYNDISFEIGGKLIILIEHQSTINPNMALRLLMYISEVFKRLLKGSSIYSTKRVSIPWPEFYVLYNGTDQYPDEVILRLSDLYAKPEDLNLLEKTLPLLDLEVKVININEGRNLNIVNQCKELSEYCIFIAKAREYWNKYNDLKKGIIEAVKYCNKNGILNVYFEKYGSEVINMLYTEWNLEDAKEVWYEEGREDEKIAIARNLLIEGSTIEFINKITGLDNETIQKLNS